MFKLFKEKKKKKLLRRAITILTISFSLMGCGKEDKNRHEQVKAEINQQVQEVYEGKRDDFSDDLKNIEKINSKALSYENFRGLNVSRMNLNDCRYKIKDCYLIGSKEKGSLYYLLSELLDTNWDKVENGESKRRELIGKIGEANEKAIEFYIKANRRRIQENERLNNLNDKSIADYNRQFQERISKGEKLAPGEGGVAGGYYTEISKNLRAISFNKTVCDILKKCDDLLKNSR